MRYEKNVLFRELRAVNHVLGYSVLAGDALVRRALPGLCDRIVVLSISRYNVVVTWLLTCLSVYNDRVTCLAVLSLATHDAVLL